MIIVVSGLPRSGTSMMMRMLEAAEIQVLTDNQRTADLDNLKGYYEDERVKILHEDNSWISESEGKAVKVISYNLQFLPPEHDYMIIFMERKIEEVLASQKKMMKRRGEPQADVSDKVMAKIFKKHLKEIHDWMRNESNIETLRVDYNETLQDPMTTSESVADFLDSDLDLEKMMNVVDPHLYHQRK